MDSAWLSSRLSNEILSNEKLFTQINSIISDILTDRLSILALVENMRGVLTSSIAENREKGVCFLTAILKHLPPDFLDEIQVKFISKFYTQRLGDHHKMLPAVLEGYKVLIEMKNYKEEYCREFFIELYKEVSCQTQSREDRFRIYQIIQKFVDRDTEYIKTLGIDFPLGFIQAIDGERDPRNLLFLFNFLPRFIKNIPLGHLVQEMFSVISCYYPIDFHPKEDDPAAVTRQDLADALAPCLYATPEFADQCLVLMIEKLDSNLRVAKLDSLKLLADSCQTFSATSYLPLMKLLWSSIHKGIMQKSDDEIKMASHKALAALVSKTSSTANTDQTFELFVKGILISVQQDIVNASSVSAYAEVTKILLTVANSCKESCIAITKAMIPATITYYEFKNAPKLQLASIEFLGDMYETAKRWEVLNNIRDEIKLIPRQCLAAASQPQKEYQMAGFKTLIRVVDVLETDLVVPFVEILIHLLQHSTDNDLLCLTVESIHAIARKYPELVMDLVVLKKCNLGNLTQDPNDLQKKLKLLCSLASIDDFTKIIIEEMLKLIDSDDKDSSKVVEALSESISNSSLYTDNKITEIDSDHGLMDSVLTWLIKEVKSNSIESLTHAFTLISNTMCSLTAEKQHEVVNKHTPELLERCKKDEDYFPIIERLYICLQKSVYDDSFKDILVLSLQLSLKSDNDIIRMKASALAAHFLNKAEFGSNFELLYEQMKKYLTSCSKSDNDICSRLIALYGWITKALILRGSDLFTFWFKKITVALSHPEYCREASQSICIIINESPDYFNARSHCRLSILYKQRLYESFSKHVDNVANIAPEAKEYYLLSWGYVCAKAPKTVLNLDAIKILPLIMESLQYEKKELLTCMLGLLNHFITARSNDSATMVTDSMHSMLRRLLTLARHRSMEVRMKSLNCLYEIAETYRTSIILPYKSDVLERLSFALDDKKRLVRNAAVKARTRWFLVGSPGEQKDN